MLLIDPSYAIEIADIFIMVDSCWINLYYDQISIESQNYALEVIVLNGISDYIGGQLFFIQGILNYFLFNL